MAKTLLSLAATVALLAQQTIAAPALASAPEVKRDGWGPWQCNKDTIETRVSFQSMPPEERKAYTDAINCVHSQPSSLDQSLYPAAVNKYQDYAVVHVNRTGQVHLSG